MAQAEAVSPLMGGGHPLLFRVTQAEAVSSPMGAGHLVSFRVTQTEAVSSPVGAVSFLWSRERLFSPRVGGHLVSFLKCLVLLLFHALCVCEISLVSNHPNLCFN